MCSFHTHVKRKINSGVIVEESMTASFVCRIINSKKKTKSLYNTVTNHRYAQTTS